MGTATVDINGTRERALRVLDLRPDLSMAALAAHTPISESAARHYLNGSVQGTAATARAINGVLDSIERGDILAPGGGEATVITEASEPARRVQRAKNVYITDTVRRVEKILSYCADEGTIGVVTGTYGAGKTEAVKIWRRKQRGVASTVFEFDEFSARNKVEFVGALAELLGVERVEGPQYGGATFRRVCEALRAKPRLLILDQCESLSVPVFQVIRQIWDRTAEAGVGMTLLAAPVLLARLKSSQAKDLGALSSRVGVWGVLTGMSRSEMAEIVKAEGVTEVDDDAFDLWFRACAGSMRRLMRSLDLLRTKGVKRVGEKTVTDVAGYLFGMGVGGAA